MSLFKTVRFSGLAIGASILGGVTLVGIIAWLTGAVAWFTNLIDTAFAKIGELWQHLMAWIDQPFDLAHLFAGAGVVLVPLLILGVIVLVLSGE